MVRRSGGNVSTAVHRMHHVIRSDEQATRTTTLTTLSTNKNKNDSLFIYILLHIARTTYLYLWVRDRGPKIVSSSWRSHELHFVGNK